MRGRLAIAILGLLGAARAAAAQDPDSVRVDSLAQDTTDYSELFLRTQEESRYRVRSLPRLGATELLPARSRMVFDRDTIDWHNAETLGDLLTKVPGVYLWRGGWIGRPEPVNYQARGVASVEYYMDGFPYVPLGPDSLAVDPSVLPLSFLSRVEVERMPGQIRVHLFTRRHDRLSPRTRVAVSSGDLDIARYQGGLEKRFANGLGYAAAAEHLTVPLTQGQQGAYSSTQAWLQASYMPSDRLAIMAQWVRTGVDRGTITATGTDDTLSAGLDGTRTDLQASLFYSSSGGPTGSRFGILAARSAWREDSTALSLGPIPPHQHIRYIDQTVWQLGGVVGHRTRSASFEASGWYRSRWTPFEVRASAGLAPFGSFAGSLEAVYRRHDGDRTSRWVTARAGIRLPLDLQATVMARTGSIVNHPTIEAEAARSQTDIGVVAGIDRRRFGLEVGYWRTDAFSPRGFPLYRTVVSIGPSPPTNWITVSARVAPRQWFILDAWHSNPRGTVPDGLPPTHSVVNGTIQSKFLRTFRSGIFGLKLQGAMETWGTGVIGRDRDGIPITLRGATFFRGLIALQLGDFIAYYDRSNLQGNRLAYVPGLPIFRFASTFGVRWEFSN